MGSKFSANGSAHNVCQTAAAIAFISNHFSIDKDVTWHDLQEQGECDSGSLPIPRSFAHKSFLS